MSTVTERHVARVCGNDDPEKRGRIKVTCVSLLGDDETPLAVFVDPALDWGMFVIPEIGEVVEIEVTVSSSRDESFKQASVDQLEPRWRGARFFDVAADSPANPVHPDFTSKNYGKRRGFSTPRGHTTVYDDTEGEESITTTWRSKDGKVTSSTIDKDGVTISIEGGASFALSGKDGSTTLKLGDGAQHVAIVEALQAFYSTALKATFLDVHVHPEVALRAALGAASAGLGTAGADPTLLALAPLAAAGLIAAAAGLGAAAGSPPTPPLAPSPVWDSAINSSKVSIPNG